MAGIPPHIPAPHGAPQPHVPAPHVPAVPPAAAAAASGGPPAPPMAPMAAPAIAPAAAPEPGMPATQAPLGTGRFSFDAGPIEPRPILPNPSPELTITAPPSADRVVVPPGVSIVQQIQQPSGALTTHEIPGKVLQPPGPTTPLNVGQSLFNELRTAPESLPIEERLGAGMVPATELPKPTDPGLWSRMTSWFSAASKASDKPKNVDLTQYNAHDQTVRVYDALPDVDEFLSEHMAGTNTGQEHYDMVTGLAKTLRQKFLREAKLGLPVSPDILNQELNRHLIDRFSDDSMWVPGTDGPAALTKRAIDHLTEKRKQMDPVRQAGLIIELDKALAPLEAFYKQYAEVPRNATRKGVAEMIQRAQTEALVQSGSTLVQANLDHLMINDHYEGKSTGKEQKPEKETFVRRMRVPVDPITGHVLAEVMHQVGSAILDGRESPSFARMQHVLDIAANNGTLEELFHTENDDGHTGTLDKEAPDKLRTAHTSDQLSIYKFLQDDVTNQEAWNFLIGEALVNFDHPDTIWGSVFRLYANRWHRLESAFSLGSKVGNHFTERLKKGFNKKSWEAMSPEDQHLILSAIESPDPLVLEAALERHPGLSEAMAGYFAVMAGLEHFKVLTPELKSSFQEHYVTHRYPRFLEFVGSGADIAHVSGIPGQKLYTELVRTISDIPTAQRLNRDAEAFIREKGFKNWREFVFGPAKHKGIWDAEARTAALFGADQVTAENLQATQQTLKHVLLGDMITDPGTLLREQIIAAFRADASRAEIHQLRALQTADGMPLLAHRTHKGDPRDWVADVRLSQFGRIERGEGGKYKKLDSIPGFANMYIEGKPSTEWYIHPMAAEFLKKQYLYKTPDKGGMQALRQIWDGVRGVTLFGSWLPHYWSTQSAMFQSAGWNFSLASGFLTMGEHMRNKRAVMVMDAVRSGLQPQTYLRMIKEVSNGVAQDSEQHNVLKQVFGVGNRIDEGANRMSQIMKEGVIKPLEHIAGIDEWLNRHQLFGAITDSMIGGWLYHTERIWAMRHKELLNQTGGNFNAAYALAKNHAATLMNDRTGAVVNYAYSDKAREAAYKLALTPQLLLARIGYVAGTLDNLTSQLGKRGKYSTMMTTGLREDMRKQNWRFIAGSMVASMVFMDLLSRFTNGVSWVHNDHGKPNHVLVDIDEETGVRTYINNPMFGMTRPITNWLLKAIKDRDPVGATIAQAQGQLHPALRVAGSLLEKGAATYRSGVPVTPSNMGFHTVGDYAEWLGYSFLPTEETLGVSDMPYVGAPLSTKDFVASFLGMSVSRIHPMRVLANEFDKEIRPIREKDFKALMQPRIDAWAEAVRTYGEDSLQAEEAMANIEYAALEGVPFPDPYSEVAQAYADIHVDPLTGQPDNRANFFIHDPESLRDMLLQARVPGILAFRSAPKILQMRLLRLAYENAAPFKFKGYDESMRDAMQRAADEAAEPR